VAVASYQAVYMYNLCKCETTEVTKHTLVAERCLVVGIY